MEWIKYYNTQFRRWFYVKNQYWYKNFKNRNMLRLYETITPKATEQNINPQEHIKANIIDLTAQHDKIIALIELMMLILI